MNQPITTNLATQIQFVFNLKRTPSISYHCQAVKLPSVSFDSVDVMTPFLRVPFIGDHIHYDNIILSFKVDEIFQNWQEILNWMNGITNPDGDAITYKQMETVGDISGYGIYSDVTVIQLDSQNNPLLYWTFTNAFPISLSAPEYNASDAQVKFITSSVTFKYTNFTITTASNYTP